MKNYILLISLAFLIACNGKNDEGEKENVGQKKEEMAKKETADMWRGVIALNDSVDLPFNFEMETGGEQSITIFNGEERIPSTDMSMEGDSTIIKFPVFANYLKVSIEDEAMSGFYINPDADNYRLPFNARAGEDARFEIIEKNCCDINKKWVAKFNPGTEDEYPAIGYFQQQGNKVTGTFMTETGDYRYLDGTLSGEELNLSAFDGAHLFVFKARIMDGQKMQGHFFSGRSFSAPWMAYRDDDFELRDPEELTYLKKGADRLEFSFSTIEGETVSLDDERFKNKPVIVQIMGSWCPNCMDESRYLKQVYDQYNEEGLEIVALTFERARDKEAAIKRAQKMQKDLNLPYPILMAGYTRADKAGEILPQLNHVMSYPTSIYLNKDHEVVKIHTGFSGPGTPVYDGYVAANKIMIEKLIEKES